MITDPNKYIRLFSNCIPVKGAQRTLICDVQRSSFKFIPNDLYEILILGRDKTLGEIIGLYGEENKSVIDDYIKFLYDNEFIFLCDKDELPLFPEIDLTWDAPAVISNAIIDIGPETRTNITDVFRQLEQLGCKFIQLRCFVPRKLEFLRELLDDLKQSIICGLNIVIPYHEELNEPDVSALMDQFPRLNEIIIFNAPENRAVPRHRPNLSRIIYSANNLMPAHCGVVDPSLFSISLPHVAEAEKHNTCLNRKVSIDMKGDIKNCPSTGKSYGNIENTTLTEAINKTGYKDLWFISKSQIDTCKDCEFRSICTDCRAFTENPEDIYSKPLKCGYSPYTTVWEDWSSNPLKEQAIAFYKLKELSELSR